MKYTCETQYPETYKYLSDVAWHPHSPGDLIEVDGVTYKYMGRSDGDGNSFFSTIRLRFEKVRTNETIVLTLDIS